MGCGPARPGGRPRTHCPTRAHGPLTPARCPVRARAPAPSGCPARETSPDGAASARSAPPARPIRSRERTVVRRARIQHAGGRCPGLGDVSSPRGGWSDPNASGMAPLGSPIPPACPGSPIPPARPGSPIPPARAAGPIPPAGPVGPVPPAGPASRMPPIGRLRSGGPVPSADSASPVGAVRPGPAMPGGPVPPEGRLPLMRPSRFAGASGPPEPPRSASPKVPPPTQRGTAEASGQPDEPDHPPGPAPRAIPPSRAPGSGSPRWRRSPYSGRHTLDSRPSRPRPRPRRRLPLGRPRMRAVRREGGPVMPPPARCTSGILHPDGLPVPVGRVAARRGPAAR